MFIFSLFIFLLFLSFCACSVPLVKFGSDEDDILLIDGKSMFKLFGRGEMLSSEVMDFIISYWKDHPDMKYMFESGDRVVLGPYTVPV